MLAPDDRSILLDLLRPPPGFSLDRAVATTFTLDLESALAVPLAFASHRISSSTDPIAVMEAVRSAADRVDVFCQAGQVKVPSSATDLLAFLEPVVHEVVARQPGHLFHPKVWVLRFKPDDPDEEETPLRLLCLTRNLTSDASWDVSLRLDGWTMSRPSASNKPIVDFLRSLLTMGIPGRLALPPERAAAIDELAEWVRYADWEWPDGISDLAFHALGIGAGSTTPDFTGRRRVVIAPFCNDEGLDVVAPPGGKDVVLVAGARDLDRLDPATLARVKPRVVSESAGLEPDDDPPAVSDDTTEVSDADVAGSEESPSDDRVIRGGLHAKVTVLERARHAVVLVGSANATGAAYGGNVEFLVELRGSRSKLGVDAVLDVETGLGRILESYVPDGGEVPDLEEEVLRDLQNLVRQAASRGWTLTSESGPDVWDVALASSSPLEAGEHRLTVEMLSRPGHALTIEGDETQHGTFTDVATADITPFLVLRASIDDPQVGPQSWATVVKAELRNEPEGRLDEILARQIDTPEKLLRFLMLVLGLGQLDLQSIGEGAAGEGATSWLIGGAGSTGFFEAIVRALADQPEAFDDIARLIERLRTTEKGREALPEGFDALWTVVDEARERIAEMPMLTEEEA